MTQKRNTAGTKPRRREIRIITPPKGGWTPGWLSVLPGTCYIRIRVDTLLQMLADARVDELVDRALRDEVD